MTTPLYRHGDVLLAAVASLPVTGLQPQSHLVLAHGEHTGHTHRIRETGAGRLYAHSTGLYLHVTAPAATLVHEEHKAISLPAGLYRVWQQREYTPDAIRPVYD